MSKCPAAEGSVLQSGYCLATVACPDRVVTTHRVMVLLAREHEAARIAGMSATISTSSERHYGQTIEGTTRIRKLGACLTSLTRGGLSPIALSASFALLTGSPTFASAYCLCRSPFAVHNASKRSQFRSGMMKGTSEDCQNESASETTDGNGGSESPQRAWSGSGSWRALYHLPIASGLAGWKYRRLFSSQVPKKPGPKGPSQEVGFGPQLTAALWKTCG